MVVVILGVASLFGFYGGGFIIGCALGEMTTTNNTKLVNTLLVIGFGLLAIPLGTLSYVIWH